MKKPSSVWGRRLLWKGGRAASLIVKMFGSVEGPFSIIKSFRKEGGGAGEGEKPFFKRVFSLPRLILSISLPLLTPWRS